MEVSEKHPGGRPSKYKPEYAEIAARLANEGATNADLADAFGVAISTISMWKVQYPEFSAAVKIAKDAADYRVENALFNRAMGYSHEDTDIRVVDGAVVMTPIVKHYPPDTAAAIFWLKNRRKEQWRDKQEIELTGSLAEKLAKARSRSKRDS